MTNTIWQTLAHTPWWVFVIFIYLVYIGLLATKPRTVPVKKLFILPTLLILLSMFSLSQAVQLNFHNISIWLGTLIMGSLLGWLQFKVMRIKAIKNEAKLYIPGSWSLLVILMVIFAAKYYLGHEEAVTPEMLKDPKIVTRILALFGLFTGIFVGRVTYALRCLRVGPYAT